MIFRIFTLLFLLTVFSAGIAAAGVGVTPQYLAGKWVLGEKSACGAGDYLIMRDNRTLEMGKGGKAGVVGFWELDNDTLTLHMLVSPKTMKGQNPFYRESYRYQYITAKVLETTPDAFGVIVGSNLEAGLQTLTRCP